MTKTICTNAAWFVRELHRVPTVTIASQSDISFDDAVLRYERCRDKPWGLTDCASSVVMEQLGLNDALASDRPCL